jgi:hypothetical protein
MATVYTERQGTHPAVSMSGASACTGHKKPRAYSTQSVRGPTSVAMATANDSVATSAVNV